MEKLRKRILNKTVDDYSLKLRQHAYKFEYSRMVAYNRLLSMISGFAPTLSVYGSWATGFALADSDVDIAVSPFILSFFLAVYGTTRDKIVTALNSIRSIIEVR